MIWRLAILVSLRILICVDDAGAGDWTAEFLLGGAAFAHRESTVRGLSVEEAGGWFDGGYELTGPVIGLGAGSTLPVYGPLELAFEVRLIQSWISVDVAEGRAETTNFALHLLAGPRFVWSR
jgi:hypothetical protein